MIYFGKIAIERRYRVRWRFDFHGKPSRTGIWNNSGGKQEQSFGSSAWCVNKDGLARASIEGELCSAEGSWTGKIVTLCECDGWDFVNFAWMASTPAPFMLGELTAMELSAEVTGLMLETREIMHQIRVDGTKRLVVKTAADKAINLAGFGK